MNSTVVSHFSPRTQGMFVSLILLVSIGMSLSSCSNTTDTNSTESETTQATAPNSGPITEEEITRAQQEWADGILEISRINKTDPEAAREKASEFLDDLYGFEEGPVLFKPTKADAAPFRFTKDEAMSYFVGGQYSSEKDILQDETALASGEYYFTLEGNPEPTAAEYTFEYFRAPDGKVKIKMHHSSIHYHEDE